MLQSKSIEECIPMNFELLNNTIHSNQLQPGSHGRILLSCSQCHNSLFDNTNPTLFIHESKIQKLLKDIIVIKEINCAACMSLVGFKIVGFESSRAGQVPPPQHTIIEVNELNQFKNYLQEIENNLNARLERQNRHSKFISDNQEYIGKYYICLSNVLISPC